MIRVVLDTNIIVSALLQPLGPPAQVFVLTLGGSIRLCVSGSVYAEYEDVISRPRFARSPDIIAATLQSIREKGAWVRPADRVTACADPDDDIFLECAQAASADYLVTGNLKHFPVSWAGCRIVTPRWLLDNLPAENPAGTSERRPYKPIAWIERRRWLERAGLSVVQYGARRPGDTGNPGNAGIVYSVTYRRGILKTGPNPPLSARVFSIAFVCYGLTR